MEPFSLTTKTVAQDEVEKDSDVEGSSAVLPHWEDSALNLLNRFRRKENQHDIYVYYNHANAALAQKSRILKQMRRVVIGGF
jgi:hypothetical protein